LVDGGASLIPVDINIELDAMQKKRAETPAKGKEGQDGK
jgi:hypothetical protein